MKGKVSGIVDSNIVFYKDCASFSFGTSKEFRHEIQDFLNGLSSKHNKHNFDHFFTSVKHEFMKKFDLKDETAAKCALFNVCCLLASKDQTLRLVQVIEEMDYQDQVNIMDSKFPNMVGSGMYATVREYFVHRGQVFFCYDQKTTVVY